MRVPCGEITFTRVFVYFIGRFYGRLRKRYTVSRRIEELTISIKKKQNGKKKSSLKKTIIFFKLPTWCVYDCLTSFARSFVCYFVEGNKFGRNPVFRTHSYACRCTCLSVRLLSLRLFSSVRLRTRYYSVKRVLENVDKLIFTSLLSVHCYPITTHLLFRRPRGR